LMYWLLHKNAGTLTDETFNNSYGSLRVTKEKLWYYIFRYFKLAAIAIVIGSTYQSSPAIPLIILIILNALDGVILIKLQPLSMIQPTLISATVFYPWYPQVYYYTTIIQQFLFIIM
jgi:hypothetical protein